MQSNSDKIIEELLNDEKIKDTFKRMKNVKSMDERQPMIRELLSEVFSKMPNPVRFVEKLKDGSMIIDDFLNNEKIREYMTLIGSYYNLDRARFMAKRNQYIPDFKEFLDVLFSLPSLLEMFRVLRPDLYAVITSEDFNGEECLLGKIEKLRKDMVDKLKELPYKIYTVKKK